MPPIVSNHPVLLVAAMIDGDCVVVIVDRVACVGVSVAMVCRLALVLVLSLEDGN